jgi:hypothetical protein
MKKIYSIGKILLRLSGMRVTEEYEIVCNNDRAELSLYVFYYTNGEEKRRLEKRAETDIDLIINLLNECKVIKWDGFFGKNPPGLLDGTMFRFEAEVNDGMKIYAHGSNNFPKHYRDLTKALYEILNKGN